MTSLAQTPEPPYFAVIFTSIRTDGDKDYAETAERMLELARQQPGFLGFESARQEIGISVSYWSNEGAIRAWKQNLEHLQAQGRGMSGTRRFASVCAASSANTEFDDRWQAGRKA